MTPWKPVILLYFIFHLLSSDCTLLYTSSRHYKKFTSTKHLKYTNVQQTASSKPPEAQSDSKRSDPQCKKHSQEEEEKACSLLVFAPRWRQQQTVEQNS